MFQNLNKMLNIFRKMWKWILENSEFFFTNVRITHYSNEFYNIYTVLCSQFFAKKLCWVKQGQMSQHRHYISTVLTSEDTVLLNRPPVYEFRGNHDTACILATALWPLSIWYSFTDSYEKYKNVIKLYNCSKTSLKFYSTNLWTSVML